MHTYTCAKAARAGGRAYILRAALFRAQSLARTAELHSVRRAYSLQRLMFFTCQPPASSPRGLQILPIPPPAALQRYVNANACASPTSAERAQRRFVPVIAYRAGKQLIRPVEQPRRERQNHRGSFVAYGDMRGAGGHNSATVVAWFLEHTGAQLDAGRQNIPQRARQRA